MKDTLIGRKRMKALAALAGALVLFYLVVSFLLGGRGVVKHVKLRDEKAALKSEIEGLKAANEMLSGEVESLKGDPEYMERLAREQGLVKKGEIIYQYEEER